MTTPLGASNAVALVAVGVAAAAVVAAVIALRRGRGEDLHAGFLDAMPDAIVVADAGGTIIMANRAAAELLGYAPGELMGRRMSDVMPPELDVSRAGRAWPTADGDARGLPVTERTITVRRRDGSSASVVAGVAPWHSPRGLRYVACLADNEPRQRAETEAQAEHQAALDAGALSEAIIRSAAVGVLLYEAETGQCVMANPAAAAITGLTQDALLRQRFREIESWKRSGLLDAAEEALAHGKRVQRDVHIVTSAGKAVDLGCDFMAVALRNRAHLVLVLVDQTERRSLEQQLRVSQKMEAIGQLAGGVAHDFNNLLTVIGTYSHLLLEECPEGDSRREDLMEIYSAAQRASALTRQLLAFGRRQLLEPRLLDLNDVVRELEKLLRRTLPAEIALELRLAPDLAAVFADAGQIEQVVMNIVVNARDAMPGGGRIVIETENVELPPDTAAGSALPAVGRRLVPRPRVALRISDTGHGMDKETLGKIFEPFFTTKPAGKGTGLGLATAYGIVKQSGGTIQVSSEPGKGTTFEILLPRSTEPSSAHEAASASGAGDAPGAGDVLVAEDDDHVRRIVVEALTSRGYTVTAGANGREALELAGARTRAPDLVVTDVVMPEMSGPELVQRLRARWPDLRALFITAYATTDVEGGRVADMPGSVLRKPFLPAELGAAVRDAMLGPARRADAGPVAAAAPDRYLADASKSGAVGSSGSGS